MKLQPPTGASAPFSAPACLGLVSLAYFAAQELAFLFPDSFGLIAAVWPAAGIALAALLLSPRGLWPALLGCLFAVGLLANLTTDRPVFASVGFMIANVCETAASAWLIRRWCGDAVRFGRKREVLALAFVAIVVNAVTALLGAGAATLAIGARFWTFYGTWWVADGLGLLLVTPLIVTWATAWRTPAGMAWARVLETTALLVLGGVVAWFTFGGEAAGTPLLARPYLLLIFVSWAASRAGTRGTVTLLALFAVIAVACTAAGVGAFPLGGTTPELHLLSVQVFLGAMGLGGLLLAASVAGERETQALLHQDIAERTRAEAELRRSEERFDSLLTAVNEGVWSSSADGRDFLYANPAFERIYGRPISEFKANPDLWKQVVHPDDQAAVNASAQVLPLRGSAELEYRITRPDGGLRWVLDRKTLVRDGEGKVVRIGGIISDVTERRWAEEDTRRLEGQLHEAQKMELVGRLAGGVAHEFNNKLMGIMSYAELSRDELPAEHPVRGYLDEITTEAQHSADIARQLLAFARRQTIAPGLLDLNRTLPGMLGMLRHLLGEDIEVAWVPGADLWTARMDCGQLEQILASLCANARNAIAGAGKVTIDTANVTLDSAHCVAHSDARPGEYVRLRVSDNGCGMSAETLEHLFEPFYTTQGLAEGTGLGLATVYGIVAQNHGHIEVHSDVGKGTSFGIYLPRAASPSQSISRTPGS